MNTGFAYMWMYDVRDGCEGVFEALYGPEGDWVRLFRKSCEYRGTDLLHDRTVARRYVTVDRWISERGTVSSSRRMSRSSLSWTEKASSSPRVKLVSGTSRS